MKRTTLKLFALGFGLIGTVSLTVAEEPKTATQKEAESPSKTDRNKVMKALEQDFMQARQKGFVAMQKATTEAGQLAAKKLLPQESDYIPKILALLKEDAGDDVAITALTMAIFAFETKDKQIAGYLEQNIKNPKMIRFVSEAIGGAPPGVKPVLERLLKDSTDLNTKGLSCFALAQQAFEEESEKTPSGKNPDFKTAAVLFKRLSTEFAEVKLDKTSLADVAQGFLFEIQSLNIGQPAPEAISKNLKGDKASLADFKGKVVVLDFWGTFCPPCRAMIPHSRKLVEKMKDKPFAFISVSGDEEKKELEDFLKTEKMPWEHWWDGGDAALLKKWNIRVFPTVYVIDSKGVIRHRLRFAGEFEDALKEIDDVVMKLVAEAEKK